MENNNRVFVGVGSLVHLEFHKPQVVPNPVSLSGQQLKFEMCHSFDGVINKVEESNSLLINGKPDYNLIVKNNKLNEEIIVKRSNIKFCVLISEGE